jgi:hypothetical protein
MSARTTPKGEPTWRFLHVSILWGTVGSTLVKNLAPDQVATGFICPYLLGEVYLSSGGAIINTKALRTIQVFGSNQPIDSNWPSVSKPTGFETIDDTVVEYLEKNGHNYTAAAFKVAGLLITAGVYETNLRKISRQLSQNEVFVISRIGDPEVDELYHGVIKPRLISHKFEVIRADEIRHTGLVTAAISDAITRARFIVADLTNARPNCYYEVGYAHALGKPCILIAKEGTERHFDVAGYRWNHWKAGVDYGPKFEEELNGVLESLAEAERVGMRQPET